MKWTNEKPVKAGWYWYQELKSFGPTIINIQKDESAGKLYVNSDDWKDLYVEDFKGQWSGPIPEPED